MYRKGPAPVPALEPRPAREGEGEGREQHPQVALAQTPAQRHAPGHGVAPEPRVPEHGERVGEADERPGEKGEGPGPTSRGPCLFSHAQPSPKKGAIFITSRVDLKPLRKKRQPNCRVALRLIEDSTVARTE